MYVQCTRTGGIPPGGPRPPLSIRHRLLPHFLHPRVHPCYNQFMDPTPAPDPDPTPNPKEDHTNIDELLMQIEVDAAKEQYNGHRFRVRLPSLEYGDEGPVPLFKDLQISDFAIMPGGELIFYRTGEQEDGSGPVTRVVQVYARHEWEGFERL